MTVVRPVRTLVFSTLFPSSARPGHGIFVETRLRELLKSGEIDAKVLAPVPWFPSTAACWGERALMARTPAEEVRNGIEVFHPRYPLLPKIGMNVAPLLLAAASVAPLRRLIAKGWDFDVIDAHYFYPDGVAAALLAKHFGKPFVVTARGSDLNLIPQHLLPRRMMQWAARRADANVGVCNALVDILRGWDVEAARLHVLRNGVDLARFRPLPRAAARAELGIDAAPVFLSVGNLVELKGHRHIIDAMAELVVEHPRARLILVGKGPEQSALERHARERGIAGNVTFAGAVDNQGLARWYSAADMLILASSREGWANVLLEAMACGTPVVATRIGGTPEVVATDVAGLLVERRDGPSLAAAMRELLARPRDPAQVRAYAEGFGWESTSRAQVDLFQRIVTAHAHPAHG